MDLDIPAPWSATHRPSRTLYGLPEGGHHVLAHGLGEVTGERPLAADHAIAAQHIEVGCSVKCIHVLTRSSFATAQIKTNCPGTSSRQRRECAHCGFQ